MKKKIIWTLVILVLVALGVFLIYSKKNEEANLPKPKQYSVVVSGFEPKNSKTELTLPYIALVENDKDVSLSTKVSGRVEFIKPTGSKVRVGETLVRLDDTDIKASINSLDAQIKSTTTALENLKKTHQRTLELLEIKGASIEQSQQEESEIAKLEAQLESLKQNKNEAQNNLGYAEIKSPANGILSNTSVNPGDVVMPGQPVGNVSANTGSNLLIRVPEDITVKGVNIKNQFYQAVALNNTFNGLVEYKVYPKGLNLIAGSREQIDVVVFKGEAIKLPHDVILNRDGKNYVLVIEDNQAALKQIDIIQSGEDGVVIDGNEILGSQLVRAEQDILLKLTGGTPLTVKN